MAARPPPPDPALLSELLSDSLRAALVPLHGFVGLAGLSAIRVDLHPLAAGKFGADRARSAVAAALPYGEGPPEPSWARAVPGPRAAIARFARSDWYGELAARLKAAAARTRAVLRERGLDPGPLRDWRYLSNSGLPEKRFALAAGIAVQGRHGLVMAEGAGSAVVLGLLLLPFELATAEGGGQTDPDPGCAGCGACIAACPTRALVPDGQKTRFLRERCLQHWTTVELPLPDFVRAAWGRRLYGCDACQEACPRFRPDPKAATDRGSLGPGLPATWLSEAPDEEIRGRLRGTALGLGWMPVSAFRRNASFALDLTLEAPGPIV
ncbi:MAG: 4Fe-4S double cluster binding domain-containing protein [Spirochaetaceae bacterium]|nr:4Fe-4S double cluster binding domain-containing protein [Spirochaetaceae bacterium]